LKHLLTTLGAALVLAVAGAGIASAQTAPSATTTTSIAGTGKRVTVAQAPESKPKPRKPLIIIHVGSQSTFNVGSSDLPRPNYYCSAGSCGATGNWEFVDPITHLTYGANIPLGKFSLNYAHGYVNQNIGRVAIPATYGTSHSPYTYQSLNDDRTDDASLSTTWHAIALAIGWHQRVRMCCGSIYNGGYVPGGTNTLPTAEHWWYLNEGTRVGPGSKYFGKLFGLTVGEQMIPHNGTTVPCIEAHPYASCVPYGGTKLHVQFTPNLTVPIGGKTSSFALFGTYTNNFDYFVNSPIQYLYNEVDYGFHKKWPPYVTLTVTNSNLYQIHSGYPYDNADTINRNKLLVTLDVALPFY